MFFFKIKKNVKRKNYGLSFNEDVFNEHKNNLMLI